MAFLLALPLCHFACNSSQNYNAYAGTKGNGLDSGMQSAPTRPKNPAECLRGVIVHVSDGDTADFRSYEGKELRLRFFGIDAPESSQEFGAESRRYTTQRLLKQPVEVFPQYDDQYGRSVAMVFLNGKDFCLELIAKGYAWHWARYYDNLEYARAMSQAQASKVGLWGAAASAGYDPIPPWEYRKSHPRRSKKTNN